MLFNDDKYVKLTRLVIRVRVLLKYCLDRVSGRKAGLDDGRKDFNIRNHHRPPCFYPPSR